MWCASVCVCVWCVLATTNQHLKCNIKANWQRDSARNLPRVFNALALYLPAAVVVVPVCVCMCCACVCVPVQFCWPHNGAFFSCFIVEYPHICRCLAEFDVDADATSLPPPLLLKASVQHNY